tara:strand:- start:24189 stop:24317 length:129 start_codon:yes stop_codon:yes gene_type:complete
MLTAIPSILEYSLKYAIENDSTDKTGATLSGDPRDIFVSLKL